LHVGLLYAYIMKVFHVAVCCTHDFNSGEKDWNVNGTCYERKVSLYCWGQHTGRLVVLSSLYERDLTQRKSERERERGEEG